ncbi:MAG: potassium channel protein [Actinobacteria bacterium]|nr:potassium channel protein [Actinomycetota bacterium]
MRWSAGALLAVLIVGTVGYTVLGFTVLDASYQTVTTVSTVGFREVEPLTGAGKVFTIVLILAGVGTALYTFGVVFEFVVEGDLRQMRRRKRMDRSIAQLDGHVVVCGWGRVGRAIAHHAAAAGKDVVVIDRDPARLEGIPFLTVVGDATDDHVLLEGGVDRAAALIAAIDTDAENLYVTLSGRSLQPALFIIARARDEGSEAKLRRAGADRVVNPQALGGARMAAFVSQPHVAEFLDVVMHDDRYEFRLEEVNVVDGSPWCGRSLDQCAIRETTGALVLALRTATGEFITNPPPSTDVTSGQTLIVIGTPPQLEQLLAANVPARDRPVRSDA